MSSDRVALQPVYILHRRPYRESSLLVEAFSAEYGRIGLIAKGAQRPGRWQGLLQPFRPLLFSWSGRGELRTLTGAEPQRLAPPLAGRTLFSGFYLNELLIRLLQREDPHPELYHRYDVSLAALAGDEEWALRLFERDLLREIGYGLNLESDGVGQPLSPETLYDYHVEQGPFPSARGTTGSLRVHGGSLLALSGVAHPGPQARQEAKRLLRGVLAVYLGGRPLESRELYRNALGAFAAKDEQE
jgi:DNA repair protein RecO (recombination protein O)